MSNLTCYPTRAKNWTPCPASSATPTTPLPATNIHVLGHRIPARDKDYWIARISGVVLGIIAEEYAHSGTAFRSTAASATSSVLAMYQAIYPTGCRDLTYDECYLPIQAKHEFLM